MTVAIGSDEAGFSLKETISGFLKEQGYEVTDYGVCDTAPSLYPDTALKVALAIQENKQERGILICGTGIGMAMTANKVPGIRAAQCHDTYSAAKAKTSNDAQIITFGARVIGTELAKDIVSAFLKADTISVSSVPKLDRMKAIDLAFRNKE